MTRSTAALFALVLLAGCGGGDEAGVGGPTAQEAAQLNDAAEMLDASPDSLSVPEDMPLDTESNQGVAADNGV